MQQRCLRYARASHQSCGSTARFSVIFGYFCFQDKSDSPISLRSKRGETMFSGFCASKTVPIHPNEVRKPSTVGYSTVSEALTQTGPNQHEGNSSVSVKPPLPVRPAAQPRALKGIFGYFCFQEKSDSPISLRSKRGEMVFSGFCAAKPCLNFTNLGDSQKTGILTAPARQTPGGPRPGSSDRWTRFFRVSPTA